MLPDFFVVGAQKSGTTSLHQYLRNHPDIYLPAQKETKFFVDDNRYAEGLAAYRDRHFSAWNGETAAGEVDPDYMYFEQALPRIAEQLDIHRLKFVFVFRNPADRAFSHYRMTYRRGLEKLPFEQAVDAEQERILKDYVSRMHYSYVDRGYYARQVNRFLKYCERSRMLFVLSDELHSDPGTVVSRICRFLQVDPEFEAEELGKRFHQATMPRSMAVIDWLRNDGVSKRLLKTLLPVAGVRRKIRKRLLSWNQVEAGSVHLEESTRQRLMSLYADDIAELGSITGLDTGVWLKPENNGHVRAADDIPS